MKLESIMQAIREQIDDQIENAYKILGAKPGPGIDIEVYPATNPMAQSYYLSGCTQAGKNFIYRFWSDPLIRSNHQLGQFKRQAEEWNLKYKIIIKFESISEELIDP